MYIFINGDEADDSNDFSYELNDDLNGQYDFDTVSKIRYDLIINKIMSYLVDVKKIHLLKLYVI